MENHSWSVFWHLAKSFPTNICHPKLFSIPGIYYAILPLSASYTLVSLSEIPSCIHLTTLEHPSNLAQTAPHPPPANDPSMTPSSWFRSSFFNASISIIVIHIPITCKGSTRLSLVVSTKFFQTSHCSKHWDTAIEQSYESCPQSAYVLVGWVDLFFNNCLLDEWPKHFHNFT